MRKVACPLFLLFLFSISLSFAQDIKQPNVSGKFYPKDPYELSATVERFLSQANPPSIEGEILVIISPHAGYEFSGPTAAFGYKAIKQRHYDTVLILSPSHYVNFKGASLWLKGAFRTPLGDVPIDESTAFDLLISCPLFSSYPEAFLREHSVEVQLPFLQKALSNFKIVPLILSDNDFADCQGLARAISKTIKGKTCLLVASSDMYHGFDYQESELVDTYTLSLIKEFKPEELYPTGIALPIPLKEGAYERIQQRKAQLCGWQAVIIAMLVAEELGYKDISVLNYTNSAKVMGERKKGAYCVGYGSIVIYKKLAFGQNSQPVSVVGKGSYTFLYHKKNLSQRLEPRTKEEERMLNAQQRKRLLQIARQSIETYLKSGKKLEVTENDAALLQPCGAFVSLHQDEQLRGCIGNLISQQPLYLTIRDMAIEAAVNDPRFSPVTARELPEIEIEISVLSPLKKIKSLDEIELGKHGVLLKRGLRSGVFLPQVATQTGWSKEEFLSNLCSHKAGLSSDAWKDPSAEIFIFSAEVFSE